MPNDSLPTAPSGEAQTERPWWAKLRELLEVRSWQPNRAHIESCLNTLAEQADTIASLSTERARMERERDEARKDAAAHEKNYLTVKDWHAEAVSDYDDEREKVSRLTSELERWQAAAEDELRRRRALGAELDRVRGALTQAEREAIEAREQVRLANVDCFAAEDEVSRLRRALEIVKAGVVGEANPMLHIGYRTAMSRAHIVALIDAALGVTPDATTRREG